MRTSDGFTHLHLHTQYSLLDGAIRMDQLVPRVAELGMRHVAVTDHGNMFGAVHFYKQAKKHGVVPILGCEAYVAPRGRADRQVRDSAHIVLLAKNNEGYKNLSYLISMGYMEGFYYNPRIDRELLKKHSRGIFGLSACLGGVVNRCILREGEAKAAEVAKEYAALFEPGHFFLELQQNGISEQTRCNHALMEISRSTKIPLVATADSHYLDPADSAAHEILMCIGHGRSLQDFRARQSHSDELFVRSPQQMYDAFRDLCPEAVENTMRIAEACRVDLDLTQTFLPNYGVPKEHSRETFLAKVAHEGLARRIAEASAPIPRGEYVQRLDYELSVINKMGFAGYFLIVWDFIRFARETGVPVGPGRGSGAGSLVAWCLSITDIDPIPLDLLFERFLNPERVSMPDFDIDFCQDRRGEVLDYVARKYGPTHVGQIVTYSQLSAKSVIKDVGRVMELPFQEVNELTKLIPNLVNGKKVSIEQALSLEPKLRQIQQDKPIYAKVMDVARALEGLNRQTGMHAAGIVIGDRPLWEYVPVLRGKEGELITQFAKDEVEEAGLVKFDFLGLKTLTVIAAAERHVRALPGDGPLGANADFAIARAPLSSPEVYRLLSRADTDGVFQLESSGFKELLGRLRPDCFEDIIAAVALYRPGPLDAGMVDDYIDRKHGRKRVVYPHEVCRAILEPTYGVIVYQEQVMRIAVAMCGFSMAEADILRKAMGKKKADVMAQMRDQFVRGAGEHSHMPADTATDLFGQIEKFAGYAFNKSHSAAYALISYQTAFLKAFYPTAFMAALLSNEMRDQDNVVRYIHSAREHQIDILPPSVNRSLRDFTVATGRGHGAHILFGLGAVKGLGDGAVEAIISGRESGPYLSLHDLCERVDLRRITKRGIEALIKSGATDELGGSRALHVHQLDGAVASGQRALRDRQLGQASLFAAFAQAPQAAVDAAPPAVPAHAAWSDRERLSFEKEALGFYITGHPLDAFADSLPRLCTAHSQSLPSPPPGRRGPKVVLGGVVGALRERPLRSGDGRMAFVTLEDLHGSCEVLVFSRVFAESEAVLKGDGPILVHGVAFVESQDAPGDAEGGVKERVKVRAESIEGLAQARAERAQRVSIRLCHPDSDGGSALLRQLKALLVGHRGGVAVQVELTVASKFVVSLGLSDNLRVNPSEAFVRQAETLLGAGTLKVA